MAKAKKRTYRRRLINQMSVIATSPPVTPEEFVRAWKRGGTVTDVAERLGSSALATAARGHRYRKLGVHLPRLERRRAHKIDIAVLNALLKA